MNKLKIVCDTCGRNINQPKPKEKKIGALVYLYFKCRRCGAAKELYKACDALVLLLSRFCLASSMKWSANSLRTCDR